MPAKTVAELPADTIVIVRPGHPRKSDVMDSDYLFPVVRIEFSTGGDPFGIGVITLLRWDDFEHPPWIAENIEAGIGEKWGPLIYDFAMEFASLENGPGLVACGRSTNHLATRIWEFYFNNRLKEVQIEPLPSEYLAGRKSKAINYIYRKTPPKTIDELGSRVVWLTEPETTL